MIRIKDYIYTNNSVKATGTTGLRYVPGDRHNLSSSFISGKTDL